MMEEKPSTSKKSRGKQCAVYGCLNFSFFSNGVPCGLHFFHIPKPVLFDKRKKDRWCQLIKRQDGRDGFSMNNHTVICEKHFKPDDIKISLGTKRWSLKEGVEPTVFTGIGQKIEKRKSPRKRLLFSNPSSSLTPDLDQPETASPDEENPFYVAEPINDSSMNDDIDVEDYIDLPNTVATQTDFCSKDESFMCDEHNYSFSLMGCFTQYNLEETVQLLRSQLDAQSEKLKKASKNIADLQELVEYYENTRFSIDKIKDDNDAMAFYTGFQNYGVFNSVFEYFESKASRLQYWRGQGNTTNEPKSYQSKGGRPGPKRRLSLKEEFFMVLIRLKVGLFIRDLAERFEISLSQFSKIFTTWINFLNSELPLLFPFPSQQKILDTMPKSFSMYPTTRIIIDCTEVLVEIPSSMLAQSQTWSTYKHHNTYKVLVGVSPTGNVTFVSDLWGGRVSDKEITKQSGLLNLLDSGDNVMADRGFEITDILPDKVTLNIPPFKGSDPQLTAEAVEDTVNIASVRIHVERAIGRIKNYHILDGVLPLSLSHVANQIFRVVAYLTCFLPPLVPYGNSDLESETCNDLAV